jgi:hypothetical protein
MTEELVETLQLIIERYNGRTQGSVFVPLCDFPWYNERNGQLKRLQEEGMITKPIFYDNGAEITLTQIGRHYFDNSEGKVSLTEEMIYKILVALKQEMKMPEDFFGYERGEAYNAIKYLQDEGLLSNVGIATGGARKPPAIIWLEGANVTLKGLEFIEKYNKTISANSDIDLTHEFVSACAKIADNPASYSSFDEDGLNREMRNFIDSAIARFGYTIADQTQQGYGKTGVMPGELDIRISKNGIPVAIYEGLIHRDRKWLETHIDKAIGKYNYSGCKNVYVVEFSRNKGFGGFWDSACETFDDNSKVSVLEENTGLLGVRMLKGTFEWNGQKGDFCYIGVNCYAK